MRKFEIFEVKSVVGFYKDNLLITEFIDRDQSSIDNSRAKTTIELSHVL